MSEPFLGQISCFGFNYAPAGWALCQGQLLPISQYSALFSLLGVQFGGNGTSNFQLPNLQGQAPIGKGQGPGTSDYVVGESGGVASVTLIANEMPAHTHAFSCTTNLGTTPSAPNNQEAMSQTGSPVAGFKSALRFSPNAPTTPLSPASVGVAGNNQPHDNMQPYLALNFCIAMQGIFPQRQ